MPTSEERGRIGLSSIYGASALHIIRKLSWPTINELFDSLRPLKIVCESVNNQAAIGLAEMIVRLFDLMQETKNFAIPKMIWPLLVANRNLIFLQFNALK